MKKVLTILILATFLSCKKNKEEISFKSIELSYREGFTSSGGTIFIRKDGSALNFYSGYPFNSSFYIRDTLEPTELNILSKQISELMKIKFDTIYGEGCADYFSKYIIIKSNSKTIISKILNNKNIVNNELISFCNSIYKKRNMTKLILEKKYNYKNIINKELYFESYLKLIEKPIFK